MLEEKKTNVPAIIADDGFNKTNEDDRLIRGSVIRYADNAWKDRDGTPIPPDTKLVAWSVTECLQQWKDKLPVRTITKKAGVPLPDVDELNREIPQEEWETGHDGKPRPPWGRQVVVYLLDAATGAELTYLSGTVGARIAVEGLRNKTGNMRLLHNSRVVPIVTLGSKLMKTSFGTRLRPEFVIMEWRDLTPAAPAITHEVGKKIEPPTLKEEMGGDEIPWSDPVDNI